MTDTQPGGCCTSCGGTGRSSDPETWWRCSDCYGSGHCHDGPCDVPASSGALDMAAIQARVDAATEGPWLVDGPFWVDPPGVLHPNELTVETRAGVTGAGRALVMRGEWETRDADAEFIAHARQDVPALAMDVLDRDMAIGGMSPEARTGNIQASVITGKGIEAASAGYSAQVANAQTMLAFGLRMAVQRCFAMDEHLWPNTPREVKGIENGIPFVDKYVPAKDIKGDHSVETTYGFMLGMAPNNALVFLLQASAAGLISKDFATRQLPIGVNPTEEQRKIMLEQLQNSTIQAVSALGQAIPQFVLNNQDPMPIIKALAEIQKRIQKGDSLEEIVVDVFAPEPPPEEQQVADPMQQLAEAASGGGGGGGGITGMAERGAMPSKGPGDRPDLAQFFAGMSSQGNAVLQGGVSRMDPIAG